VLLVSELLLSLFTMLLYCCLCQDSEYYNSLMWIMENDPECLYLTFAVDEEVFGMVSCERFHAVQLSHSLGFAVSVSCWRL